MEILIIWTILWLICAFVAYAYNRYEKRKRIWSGVRESVAERYLGTYLRMGFVLIDSLNAPRLHRHLGGENWHPIEEPEELK